MFQSVILLSILTCLRTQFIMHIELAGLSEFGRKGPVLTICEEPEVFVVKKLQKLLGVSIPDAILQRASLLSLKSGETCGGLKVMDRLLIISFGFTCFHQDNGYILGHSQSLMFS